MRPVTEVGTKGSMPPNGMAMPDIFAMFGDAASEIAARDRN